MDVSETEGTQEGLGDFGVERTLNSRKALQQKVHQRQEEVTDACWTVRIGRRCEGYTPWWFTYNGTHWVQGETAKFKGSWNWANGLWGSKRLISRRTHCNQETLGWGPLCLYSESMICIITWAKAWCGWDLGCWVSVSSWLSFLTYIENTKVERSRWKRIWVTGLCQ